MKPRTLVFTAIAAMVLMGGTAKANIVGYVNTAFQPGDNWFGNPLSYTNDLLSSIVPNAPTGTTVSLWNSAGNQFTPSATWNGSAWSTDLTLAPGTGALLNTPTQFTNTFTGQALNFDGSPLSGIGFVFAEPPPFGGPNGLYLLSSKAPVELSGHVFSPDTTPFTMAAFESIIGRLPHDGEQVTTLDPLTQTYTTTTFLGGVWNNGDPSLPVGQAAMFNIGPVPEPSALGLLLAGLGVAGIARRRIPSRG
jgi:hypothetical protein